MPQSPPLEVKWVEHAGTSPLAEVRAYVNDPAVVEAERSLRKAEVFSRLNHAREGRLQPRSQVREVRGSRVVWEIRWDSNRKHLRLYVGEPPEHPRHLVPLLFHVKDVEGTDEEIHDAQDLEMSQALLRYQGWASHDWFL